MRGPGSGAGSVFAEQRRTAKHTHTAHAQTSAAGELQWVALLGGNGTDTAQDVAVGPDGR